MIYPFVNNSKINSQNTDSNFIEIMDTTLRDGEQTEGVSFSKNEKFAIAKKLLTDVKVDRIEITSAKVSEGEKETCKLIFDWAKKNNFLEKVEVLGFVDYNKSVDWINDAGGKVINLLCKGSKNHCENQLNKKPKEHFKDIEKTIFYAKEKNFIVNVYLEDFSNGIKEKNNYVIDLIKVLKKNSVKRVLLADTLGILSTKEVEFYINDLVKKFPTIHFDFHAHNDYGLATANSFTAIMSGVKGVHTTINGLGERTGNTPLEEIVPLINDFSKFKVNVDEKKLQSISRLVELFSRYRVSKNKPIVGVNVFTQTAGIHADGDKKGQLYISKLSSKRFGRNTRYALGKLSGKSSISLTLKNYGIFLEENELKEVLNKVIMLGDKKEYVSKEDLLFIVDEVRKNNIKKDFEVLDYKILVSKNKKPLAKIKVNFIGKKFISSSFGTGGFDAFIKSLKKIFKKKNFSFPKLEDYEVRIPVGGRTDALVETKIIWKRANRTIETIGVSTDQTDAAIKSTEKMVNIL